jgi:ribosome assembly protein YihI (activator of Der GTPase)
MFMVTMRAHVYGDVALVTWVQVERLPSTHQGEEAKDSPCAELLHGGRDALLDDLLQSLEAVSHIPPEDPQNR